MSRTITGPEAAFAPASGFLPSRATLTRRKVRCTAIRAVQEAPPALSRAVPVARPASQDAARVSLRRLFGRNSVAPKRHVQLAVDGDFMRSTWLQRTKTWGFFALAAAESIKVCVSVQDVSGAAATVAAAIGGYLFADLGTGFYHWAVDNYGSESTPIVGRQIAAFQGHHSSPWTIAQREFANNLHSLTQPTAPQLVLLLLSPGVPTPAAAFATTALTSIVLSQEMHRQAHMTRPSPIIDALQHAGLALPRSMHARHHAQPHADHYCIVSGICNAPLDNLRIFRRLEAIVYRLTGNEPISWGLKPALKEESLSL
eukprot:IDg13022t1